MRDAACAHADTTVTGTSEDLRSGEYHVTPKRQTHAPGWWRDTGRTVAKPELAVAEIVPPYLPPKGPDSALFLALTSGFSGGRWQEWQNCPLSPSTVSMKDHFLC